MGLGGTQLSGSIIYTLVNDKSRKSGINYYYECIKAFMGTDDFHNVSAAYGLDSQILANYFKAFASYLDVPKKD
jgi:hypothetical protein